MKASVDGLWDGHTSQNGADTQKCVVEVVPRIVVFQPVEVLITATVWLISCKMHESADDDAHSPSSFLTQSD